ncbi:MAG: hypothetical protein U9Q69_04210 [Nanoarchaeota archaeon]|nr:hypothetical protein [Nanoarchaeota archaeon]
MKDAAKKLDGKVMTLDDVIEQLSPLAEKAGGRVGIVEHFQYIQFWVEPPVSKPYAKHMWRLIKYR